jgi:hypothetical protein
LSDTKDKAGTILPITIPFDSVDFKYRADTDSKVSLEWLEQLQAEGRYAKDVWAGM